MGRKSFVMSRTVWAVLTMVAVALFGLFAPEHGNTALSPHTIRILCAVGVIVSGIAAIYYRQHAQINLRYAEGDGQISAFLVAPLFLFFCVTAAGCVKNDTGVDMSSLDHAKVVVNTLNETYIPLRVVYEEVYLLSDPDTKAKLNKSVNPIVNKATDALATATSLLIMWAKTSEKPAAMDEAFKAAESLVPSAVQAMTEAVAKPTTE